MSEQDQTNIEGRLAYIEAAQAVLAERLDDIERAMVAFSSSCRDLDAQRPASDGVPWSQRLQIHAAAWDARLAMARTTQSLNGGTPP